jgi:hypothetical protein
MEQFDSEKEAKEYVDSMNWQKCKKYIPAHMSEHWTNNGGTEK